MDIPGMPIEYLERVGGVQKRQKNWGRLSRVMSKWTFAEKESVGRRRTNYRMLERKRV